MQQPTILVVEDEESLGQTLRHSLSTYYQVSWVKTLERSRDVLRRTTFDLILLDRGLPDGDSLELVPQLAQHNYATRILLISRKGEVADRITALTKGVDDVLPKPFSLSELKLKVHKLLQMEKTYAREGLHFRRFSYYPREGQLVTHTQQQLTLRKNQAALFHCLCVHPNRILTRKQISTWLSQYSQAFPENKTIDSYVMRLRRTLRDTVSIQTVRGFGYQLVLPERKH